MIDDPDLPPLDDDLAALLRADASGPDPSLEAMTRVRARVDASIAAGLVPDGSSSAPDAQGAPPGAATAPPTPGAPSPAVPVAASAAAGATSTITVVALVAFGLGAGVGVLGTLLAAGEPPVRIEERRVEVPVRVIETVYVVADAGLPTDAARALDAGLASSPIRSGPDAGIDVDAGQAAGTGRDRDLAGENALVSRAQSALARGRTGEALEALAEHQRRFPNGEFVEEREALAIQALARSGRIDAARARATRFRARYPRSMLLRAIDAVVGPEETP